MNHTPMQAQSQAKPACTAPTLPYVIKYLTKEQIRIASELNSMEPDAWLNVHGNP